VLCRTAKVKPEHVSNDVVLAMDYVISMQYFRIFRWNRDSEDSLSSIEDSRKLLLPGNEHFDSFLDGFKEVLGGEELKAVYAVLRFPLQSAFDSKVDDEDDEEHWLKTTYTQLQTVYQLPKWSAAVWNDMHWNEFESALLKVWLHVKMSSENSRHAVGHHSTEADRQFTETDRLIKSLVKTRVFSRAKSHEGLEPLDTGAGHLLLNKLEAVNVTA